jgi:hypothetical protein
LPHLHIPPNGRGKKKDVEKGNSPERQSSSGRRPGIILERYFTGSKGGYLPGDKDLTGKIV